jgi:hypothetical protein
VIGLIDLRAPIKLLIRLDLDPSRYWVGRMAIRDGNQSDPFGIPLRVGDVADQLCEVAPPR